MLDWLAIATFGLALATVALAIEANVDRVGRRHERERALLRAALLEQVDNCREWRRGPSGAPSDDARKPPATVRLLGLLEGVSLPAELATYLAWARSEMAVRAARHDE